MLGIHEAHLRRGYKRSGVCPVCNEHPAEGRKLPGWLVEKRRRNSVGKERATTNRRVKR